MKKAGMIEFGKWTGLAIAALCAALAGNHMTHCETSPIGPAGIPSRESAFVEAKGAYSHALPKLDGDRLQVKLVEVTYAPGASSKPHSHPCPVIGYVIQGAVRMQVEGEPEAVYKAGESFYEAPNGVHLVSANASDQIPAKFVAYFVCDHDTPVTVAVPETKSSAER